MTQPELIDVLDLADTRIVNEIGLVVSRRLNGLSPKSSRD